MADATLTRRDMVNAPAPQCRSFGTFDGRGREFGVIVSLNEASFTPTTGRVGYKIEPGYYYTANVMTARNGVPFGASNPEQYFTDEASRQAWVDKRVSDIRQRTAKQAA